MSLPDLIVRGREVVLPAATQPAAIHVSAGRIVAITAYDDVPVGGELIDAPTNAVVMPGLVDTHVHINEPGRSGWEGFATATRAAAAGGVTTLIDMPLNSVPPTATIRGLETKLAAARGQCQVDVGFWGGLLPDNAAELAPLWAAGVVGFKCFLVPSGVEEFPHVGKAELRAALPELARLGALLIVHAELPGPIDHACAGAASGNPRRYRTFLDTRPSQAEDEAIALLIRLGRATGARLHIVHLSSASALAAIREAQADGVKISAETCPHYLYFAAEEVPDGATEFKCCPPIRGRENREQLWGALRDDVIEMVVSDHSPCPPALKDRDTGDFLRAWGGISSLQLRLAILWTAARERGYSPRHLARWLCSAPAALVDLEQKGVIAVGRDADLVIWDPAAEFQVVPDILEHRHKLTPYNGRLLRGRVLTTFLRGRRIYDHGWFADASGQMLQQLRQR
jgi:allantoinase